MYSVAESYYLISWPVIRDYRAKEKEHQLSLVHGETRLVRLPVVCLHLPALRSSFTGVVLIMSNPLISCCREMSNDARNGKLLSTDKQGMDAKKCVTTDFSQCLSQSIPVNVKLEVDEATLMGVAHADAVNDFSQGLQDSNMLTTLTNSLVGL